jgi:hypothetical protein
VLKLKILVGSTRDGRAADRVVPWVARSAEARDAFAVDVLDLREWNLPMFAETIHTVGDFHDPTYSQPVIRQWNDTVRARRPRSTSPARTRRPLPPHRFRHCPRCPDGAARTRVRMSRVRRPPGGTIMARSDPTGPSTEHH